MVVVLSGKNEYALKSALRDLVADTKKTVGDLGIERLDAQELDTDTIVQAVQSLPFLVPQKLVVVDSAASNTELLDRLEELCSRVADGVTIVLVGPAFDKRKSSWALLKKHADEVREFGELKPFDLPKWVVEEAQKHTAQIRLSDATYLVNRVGSNQMILASEIEKMSLISQHITAEVIDQHTERSPQSTVFEMMDAAFSADEKKAITLYREQRSMRVDPHYIIAMLTWQLQSLALAVFAQPQNEQALVGAGQSPFAARKALKLTQKLTRTDVQRFIADLRKLDASIKKDTEADAALELYLLNLHPIS